MTLGNRASFWTAATIVLASLWVSGSPTMVYPEYQSEWHLTPTVSTAMFAVYPFTLMIVLVVFGGISDYIGRRETLLIGLAIAGVGVLLLALAPGVGWIFAGRVGEGIGIGLATSPASAALVEFNTREDKSLSGAMNSVGAALGIVLSMVVGGLLVAYAPLPTRLVFWALLALIVITIVLTFFLPKNARDTQAPGRWRPRRITVPAALRGFVAASALAVTASFALGAMLMSLGAQIAKDLLHTDNALVAGAVLSITYVIGGIVSILVERVHPQFAIVVGGVISAGFFVLTLVSATAASLPVFFLACVVGGVGYGFLFIGGLGLVNLHAPVRFRASTLALVFLVAYFGQVVISLGMGVLATAYGLKSSLDFSVPVLVVLMLVTSAFTMLFGREPRGDEAEAMRNHPSERLKTRMAPGAGELAKSPVD